MKNIKSHLKLFLCFSFVFLFLNISFSQILPKELRRVLYPIQPLQEERNFLNCNGVSLIGCNFMTNNNFTPSATYNANLSAHIDNPFNYDFLGNTLVPSWDIAVGTPTIYDGVFHNDPLPPPTPTPTGYFFGGTGHDNSVGGFYSESIVQKIPALTPNKAYTLSFYKMFKDYSYLPPNISNPLDHFRIVLMNCSTYNQTFRPITYQVPALPANSLIIYCESTVSNGTWNQVFIKFIPNQAYDMIWIYPEGDHDIIPKYSGIFVSFPELTYVDNFSAGPAPNPTPPNCNVTIGPATPNCCPTGAVFKWTGPFGQTPFVPANQQITFDASLTQNVGTWTLSMTMPNAVTTNSNCSQQQDAEHPVLVSASVNVPLCNGTCTPPTISPTGPIDYYYLFEAGSGTYTFTTQSSGSLQWFVDGQAITGASLQTFTYTFNPGSHNVKVNLNGCASPTTTINLIYYGACPQSPNPPPPNGPKNNHCWPTGITTPLFYCQGQTSYLQSFDLGPAATYSWSISNGPSPTYLTLNSQNQNLAFVSVANTGAFVTNNVYAKSELNGYVKVFDYYVNIPNKTRNAFSTCNNGVGNCYVGVSGFDNESYIFPGVITYVSNPAYQNSVGSSTLSCSGVLNAAFQVKFSNPAFVNYYTVAHTNNNYPGDCFNQTVFMQMLPYPCFAGLQNADNVSQIEVIKIFPNPASNKITITSKEIINYIEISDLMSLIFIRIKVSEAISTIINVSDLNPGIYNCKITTSKGTENQKLIIKR